MYCLMHRYLHLGPDATMELSRVSWAFSSCACRTWRGNKTRVTISKHLCCRDSPIAVDQFIWGHCHTGSLSNVKWYRNGVIRGFHRAKLSQPDAPRHTFHVNWRLHRQEWRLNVKNTARLRGHNLLHLPLCRHSIIQTNDLLSNITEARYSLRAPAYLWLHAGHDEHALAISGVYNSLPLPPDVHAGWQLAQRLVKLYHSTNNAHFLAHSTQPHTELCSGDSDFISSYRNLLSNIPNLWTIQCLLAVRDK